MKAGIHPQYHQAKVTCACGNSFTVGSTREVIEVEICSACHPFYTGTQKFIDTKGRIEKFQDRVEKGKIFHAKKAAKSASTKVKKAKKAKKGL